jgi:hypothetical protein
MKVSVKYKKNKLNFKVVNKDSTTINVSNEHNRSLLKYRIKLQSKFLNYRDCFQSEMRRREMYLDFSKFDAEMFFIKQFKKDIQLLDIMIKSFPECESWKTHSMRFAYWKEDVKMFKTLNVHFEKDASKLIWLRDLINFLNVKG